MLVSHFIVWARFCFETSFIDRSFFSKFSIFSFDLAAFLFCIVSDAKLSFALCIIMPIIKNSELIDEFSILAVLQTG